MFQLRLAPMFVYLALLLLCGAWLTSGMARADSVYSVRDVAVDASATSAAEARSIALAEGNLTAFERLVRRLVLVEDQALLPILESPAIAALIDGFVIEKERVSPKRYRANLTIDFNKFLVRKLLRQENIRFAETRSNDILVVPVFNTGAGPTLWLEPGDWRSAWLKRPVDEGLVSLVLLLGDVIDMAAIDASQAMRPARKALMTLASRYGTKEIIVASAYLALPENLPNVDITDPPNAENDPTESAKPDLSSSRRVRGEMEGAILELTIHQVGIAGERTTMELLRGGRSESMEDFLERAVGRVLVQVEGEWKQANMLRFGRENRLGIIVPLNSLLDWVDIRRRLSKLAVIVSVDLDTLSRSQAEVTLNFFGEMDQLMLGLEKSDLTLNFESRSWVLQRGGTGGQSGSSEKNL